jgi:segregation and condensation protein B
MPAAEAVEDAEPEPAAEPAQLNIAPGQVLEALLFVGGTALSPRRLADVINVSTTEIELLVDTLNVTYLEERRPYHIDLDDGHYRLALHAEFEPIRSRVHGQGPKDVRLAPDALEVLALVAYEQPLSKEDLDGSGKPEADTLIRQLIRRDLVSLTRGEDKQIRYGTTTRFLELFGLRSLNDLPRSEMLRFK